MRRQVAVSRNRRPIVLSAGIRAVGVDTIAAETGISSARSINHFPSKDELNIGLLAGPLHACSASDKPPVEQILGTFDRLERGFASKSFRGCPFVNAVAELGAEDRSVKKIAIAFKEAAASGFAICWCSSVSPIRRASRHSSPCWSMARSRRIWCGTTRRWRAPPGRRARAAQECRG